MTASKAQAVSKPWYREPWPWILMAGPFVVVIAGLITAWIAIRSSDGLVTEDYYKKGLAANQTIAQSEKAKALGIRAEIWLEEGRMLVKLGANSSEFAAPKDLRVTVSHPTRAGLDQTEVMTASGNEYAGAFRLPASGHWLVLLEDNAGTWRIMGNVVLPAAGPVVIGGVVEAADIRN